MIRKDRIMNNNPRTKKALFRELVWRLAPSSGLATPSTPILYHLILKKSSDVDPRRVELLQATLTESPPNPVGPHQLHRTTINQPLITDIMFNYWLIQTQP